MDKHDRELVDFCLQHNVKSLDEAEFALAKLKAEEPMRIENEQKEQARVHAEDIEKIEHAVEVRRSELLSRMFAYAQHDRDRAVVTINGKQVGYDTNIKGEPISVQQTIIHFTSSVAGLGTLTSVSLVDKNGSVVAGPKDATLVTGTDQKVTFTDTVTYPVGLGTYTLVG